ncbi:DUF7661 family protein [Massilia soli]|uniref:DUF7661 domain-containing protein n=1 Tax=Massilia soli TaxID=2792854 RepID=A0ABS7STZ7_9BURK|nr:hypothetical protein [Massilia soli]MBZ2209428.1 hypothetical protein [Massilia soli]
MKFDIYGRFQIEVRRENDAWEAYRLEPGKRAKVDELIIPAALDADEIATYLDDIYHEMAGVGQNVTLIA